MQRCFWSKAAGICLFSYPLPIFWLIDILGELCLPPLLLITIMARVAIFGGERRPLRQAPSSNQCKLCRFVSKCLAAISPFAFFISFLHCLVCLVMQKSMPSIAISVAWTTMTTIFACRPNCASRLLALHSGPFQCISSLFGLPPTVCTVPNCECIMVKQ